LKDLFILAADKNIEAGIAMLLKRHEALLIRPISFDLATHPRRDPGCFHECHEFLRAFTGQYLHALVIFDAAWEGAAIADRESLEEEVRNRFSQNGMSDYADVVVIAPELEAWVWSDSPHVDRILGWEGGVFRLREWLEEVGLWKPNVLKPDDPKAAVEVTLERARIARSSSIYAQLASSVSVERCSDVAFGDLKHLLRRWFPRDPEPVV
jgi:hypothetical protein